MLGAAQLDTSAEGTSDVLPALHSGCWWVLAGGTLGGRSVTPPPPHDSRGTSRLWLDALADRPRAPTLAASTTATSSNTSMSGCSEAEGGSEPGCVSQLRRDLRRSRRCMRSGGAAADAVLLLPPTLPPLGLLLLLA